jgi:hypothetical protein
MAVPGRLSNKALTAELRKLAVIINVEHFDDDGSPLTNEQALARLIWKMALGYTETVIDDNGTRQKVTHKPVAWAMQYLFERIEGKAQVAQPENESGMKAADKVRDLAKQRINALAAGVTSGPPKHKPKGA